MKLGDWDRRRYGYRINSIVQAYAALQLLKKPKVDLHADFAVGPIEAACDAIEQSLFHHDNEMPTWRYRVRIEDTAVALSVKVASKYQAVPHQTRTVPWETCPPRLQTYIQNTRLISSTAILTERRIKNILDACNTVTQFISVIPVAPKLFGVNTSGLKRARRTKVKGMDEEEAAAVRKLCTEMAVALMPMKTRWLELEKAYLNRWEVLSE